MPPPALSERALEAFSTLENLPTSEVAAIAEVLATLVVAKAEEV